MNAHPAADLFPLLEGAEFRALVKDIKSRGLEQDIITHEGLILDGRNRWRACKEAGVEPRTREWNGSGDPADFVESMNLRRRQLDATGRAVYAEARSEYDKARAAERRRAGAVKGNKSPKRKSPDTQNNGEAAARQRKDHSGEAAAQVAARVGTNRQAVADVSAIKQKAPDLYEALKRPATDPTRKTLPQAKRDLKKREVNEKLASIEVQEAKALAGVYDVAVIDPPWPMKKIDRDCRPNQVEFGYPTMNEAELAALFDADPTPKLADDAHVWLWTTQKFLPMAFRLLQRWGLKYVCEFVWHKPGGFQPIGLPQYNHEMALYARQGSPVFTTTKAFKTCFEAKRGEHSEKPDEFYDMVRRVTGGRRVDMFNRRQIEGFDGWGKEAPDAARG